MCFPLQTPRKRNINTVLKSPLCRFLHRLRHFNNANWRERKLKACKSGNGLFRSVPFSAWAILKIILIVLGAAKGNGDVWTLSCIHFACFEFTYQPQSWYILCYFVLESSSFFIEQGSNNKMYTFLYRPCQTLNLKGINRKIQTN